VLHPALRPGPERCCRRELVLPLVARGEAGRQSATQYFHPEDKAPTHRKASRAWWHKVPCRVVRS
jgi:hypothetical protein